MEGYTFRDIINFIKNDKEWDVPEEVKKTVDGLVMTTFLL